MKRKMREWKLMALLLGIVVLAASCGGGGGGSTSTTPAATTPAAPTDAATITTTTARQSVQSFATLVSPDSSYSSPRTVMRESGRTAGRVAKSVTSTIDQMSGAAGETFSISFTNEPSEDCTLNGVLNGAITEKTSYSMTLSLGGTLNYTSCTGKPDQTAVVENGSAIVATASTMSIKMLTSFTFSRSNYTTSLSVQQSYVDRVDDSVDIWFLKDETFSGTDSLGNDIYTDINHDARTGHPLSYTNKNKMDGTTNNIYCSLNQSAKTATCSGAATMSNGIVVTYAYTGTDTDMVFSYMETSEIQDDMNAYYIEMGAGGGSFTSNTGYTGSLAMNADGTGSGVLKNSAGATAATQSWDANGLCAVDYADSSMTDTQYYMSNVMAAMH